MKISHRGRYLRSTVLASATAAFASGAAFSQEPAQTDAQPEQARSSEVIQVTGSRIARDVTTSPAPLIQLTGEDIALSGEPNLVDFLATIPALAGSQVPTDTTGSSLNNGGLSLLNLRNLGAVRTLTLVDGRRHVGSQPGALSVDVDTIPSILVERVEVVTGGQSAVYGADAVSGVVNFILRDDFEGIEVDAAFAQINQDGQTNARLSAAIGENFLDNRLNVYAFGEYQENHEVLDFDIDWRRDAWGLTANDADPPGASADGVFDQILLRDRRDAFFARGGVLVLANQPRPSPTNNPNTPNQQCSTAGVLLSAACSAIRPDLPGTVWTFNADGSARLFDFGTPSNRAATHAGSTWVATA